MLQTKKSEREEIQWIQNFTPPGLELKAIIYRIHQNPN